MAIEHGNGIPDLKTEELSHLEVRYRKAASAEGRISQGRSQVYRCPGQNRKRRGDHRFKGSDRLADMLDQRFELICVEEIRVCVEHINTKVRKELGVDANELKPLIEHV